MKEPRDKIDIWTESAVFDYVAGHQSDEVREDFERRMASDPSLRQAVELERRLRSGIAATEKELNDSEPIRADNIDDLFQRIDKLEQNPGDGDQPSESAHLHTSNRNWFRIAGVAASVAVAAVIVVNQLPNPVNTDFTLLSDQAADQQADFGKLVAAQRVAQVWLAQDIASGDVSKLLGQHSLTPMSRAGSAWVVSSPEPLSVQHLAQLAATPEIDQIRLISFDGEAPE